MEKFRRRQVLPESAKRAARKQKDHDINKHQCFSESVVTLQQSQKFGEEGLEIQSVIRTISLGCLMVCA